MSDSFTSLLTGGLLDAKAPNYGALAARSEAKRKGIINLGLDQINAVYQGGTVPFYSAPEDSFTSKEWHAGGKQSPLFYQNKKGEFAPFWAPKTKGLDSSGAEIGNLYGGGVGGVIGGLAEGDIKGATQSAMFGLPGQLDLMGGLFGDDDPPTPREIVNKQIRRGNLFYAPEEKTFEGFNEAFYKKRADDYVNFALPQVADQYRMNRDQMAFGLSNRGLSDSSVGNEARSNLERLSGVARQQVAETGIEQANMLKKDVEAARQRDIAQLYQSANPSQGVQSAISNAMQLRAPSTFAPIANMFGNLAQQYYTNQILNSYRPTYGAPGYDFSEAIS